jgi:hypothetical protein
MEVEIKIRTRHSNLRETLFSKNIVKQSDTIQIPSTNAIIESKDPEVLNSHLPIEIINIMISGITGTITGIIANYIYYKIDKKADTLMINNKEIEIEIKKIKEALDNLLNELSNKKE